MLDVNYFDELRIGLATAEQIRMWSNGEVRKPDEFGDASYPQLRHHASAVHLDRLFDGAQACRNLLV